MIFGKKNGISFRHIGYQFVKLFNRLDLTHLPPLDLSPLAVPKKNDPMILLPRNAWTLVREGRYLVIF